MSARLQVGLLEFGIRAPATSSRETVAHVVDLAQHAECLGFERLWLAEHHTTSCAWASPEIIVGLLANETTRIRIGTGGLLFGVHNPLRVANDFALLSELFPQRIELGLARGSAAPNDYALVEPSTRLRVTGDEFSLDLVSLLSYLAGVRRPQYRYADALVVPAPTSAIPIWILGSGTAAAQIAATYGARYAHSTFHGPQSSLDGVAAYRKEFTATAHLRESDTMVAVAGVCAETSAAAHAVARTLVNKYIRVGVIGDPTTVAAHLRQVASEADVTQILYLDLASEPAQRTAAAAMLAAELDLGRNCPSSLGAASGHFVSGTGD